ncbi:arylsulfatase B-like isoform X2 [Macrosteles quadrilineatus]|uniref:arylsulfatase B-like isoform X2 n=1 Tax=Macrosteles quadrilineatus TaxID=74068 RepID=UPI0023E3105C|nr:arylsulfatase B-like isoform X2 [Macrosteles quadrilineatus]
MKSVYIFCSLAVIFAVLLGLGLFASIWWLDASVQASKTSPHIIIILADDLGWNDVSFHGSDQFQTPNIDALAYSGVILHDYYTQPICTPARAALLTGRHPISNGMEHDVIYAPQPWGLPLSERIIPQYLQSLNYKSHAVGKWHLGFFHSNYTPARRGFDSHYGSWLGHQDHYSHMGYEPHPGYDFHRDLNVSWDAAGMYTADLFTKEAEQIIRDHDDSQPLFLYLAHDLPHAPLQADDNIVKRFSYIPDKRRQKFAAMVTALDDSVGCVMRSLEAKNMLNNSIVLFLSDNGGATNGFNGNVASNWPLRGGKDTLWEGGVRSVGVIWSPLLESTPRVHRGLVNVQDWLPTLLEAAGVGNQTLDTSHLDGVSQWPSLQQKTKPPYSTMLHNVDKQRKIGALRHGDWKLVTGRTYNGAYDGFYGRLNGKVAYDLNKIRNSETGNAVSNTTSPLPCDSDILKMRTAATVSCLSSQIATPKVTPHVIHIRDTMFIVDINETGSAMQRKMNKRKHLNTSNEAVLLPVPTQSTLDATACKPHLSPCLFNLLEDPCEKRNIAAEFPETVNQLMSILQSYQPVAPNNRPEDPRSYPIHWNNTWTNWLDFL